MADVSSDPEQIIRVMPDTLANKIAAGEVVQRPASALKELIENAIDAGADAIEVVLKKAGSELVQVVDNGSGMSPQDAVACFQRHATSKIMSIDDLERIRTLGFRGEALASIAAVAQVELRTKRVQDAAGVCVRIHGGTVEATQPCAAPNGTSLAVRNLFYNVPARRNFLKTPATEFKHLVETFQFLALSNPDVGFTLTHDDNEVYRLTPARRSDGHGPLQHRIQELFGESYPESLVPVEETTSYLSVYGFVGTPEFHRKSRGEQFLFVNQRYVKNRYLEHAVASGYGDMLPDGAYPFFTLFLHLDPRHVDVNVHPTKAEVKFDDERGIYGFIKAVVKKALGTADLTPQFDSGPEGRAFTATLQSDTPSVQAAPGADPQGVRPSSAPSFPDSSSRSAYGRPGGWDASAQGWQMSLGSSGTPPRARSTDIPAGTLSGRLYGDVPKPTPEAAAQGVPSTTNQVATGDVEASGEALLWQLHGTYILTQIHSGLMILDQNAAHERILYERALQAMQSGFGLSQQLLFPHTIDFSPSDFELLRELTGDLRSLGFDLEFFSGRSVVVRGVPADVRPGDERAILEEILQQFKTHLDTLQIKGRDNLARSIARRSAIPVGARLSPKEMRSLIDQLFQCEMPYACPGGRPTLIKIPIEELNKRFGRSER